MAVLSYVQAPALWRSSADSARAMAMFDALAERIPAMALYRRFDGNASVLLSHFVPLGLATAIAVLLVAMLRRHRDELDSAIVPLLRRWSLAFTAVSLFAVPLFTQDFWLSAVWGRMVAAGLNPYHMLFTPELLAGLPLDHFPMLMSYGPAWAILSGAVMAIAGDSTLAAAILFKLILGIAWYACVVLVERITAPQPTLDRCLAVALVGWTPIGLTQTVAEGHNDVAMASLALLWIWLLLRGRGTAPLALAASTLCKYVTGPLFVVDLIVALRMQRLSWRQLLLRFLAPALFSLAVFAIFYRSPQFFDGTRLISEWHFLQPRHALDAFDDLIPYSLYPVELAIAAAFALLTAICLVELYRHPGPETTAKAVLAIMSTITFTVIAHLWPWYLVWTLPLAALVPRWWLSRFVIGVCLLAPFTFAFWWIDALVDYKEWAALALYTGALLWTAATRAPGASAANRHSSDRSAEQSFGHP